MRTEKTENFAETLEALKRALIGVKDPRHEAFIMLNAVPEEYLSELVEYLRTLTGLKKMNYIGHWVGPSKVVELKLYSRKDGV